MAFCFVFVRWCPAENIYFGTWVIGYPIYLHMTYYLINIYFPGDSEVQRTMLELLNQLDGFEATKNIKVRKFMFYLFKQVWRYKPYF